MAYNKMESSLMNLKESVRPMVERGISNARSHGINVHHGVPNLADGDCAIESMIDGISTQSCFEEVYEGTPEFWRRKWFTEAEDLAFQYYDAGLNQDEWRAAWNILKNSKEYEYVLGDLILPTIAHCTKKDILVFNASPRAHSPIFVIEASSLGGNGANTEIPVILVYDYSHYESLVPDTEADIQKVVDLKKSFLDGLYEKRCIDIPVLRDQLNREKFSYAGAVKQNSQPETSKKSDSKFESPSNITSTEKNKKGFKDATTSKIKNNVVKKTNVKPKLQSPPQKRRKQQNKNTLKLSNKFATLSDTSTDTEQTDSESSLEKLMKIKKKDRTPDEQTLYEHLMKIKRREKIRISMSKSRAQKTSDEKLEQNRKDREAKASSRNRETSEERVRRVDLSRKTMRESRGRKTPEEKLEQQRKNREAKSITRKRETSDERMRRLDLSRKTMCESRGRKTPEERLDQNRKDREAKSRSRARETSEETKKRNERNKKSKQNKRNLAKSMPASIYEARNGQKILFGEQIVSDLDVTNDSIGKMNNKCDECGALKWKDETSTLCCNNGKVYLESFPDPPDYLKRLWTADTADARLFRENSRSFNNSLALSSIKKTERRFDNNYNPSVIFEGKVSQIYGPLQASENETPKFSQLYVLDPATEHTMRIANMNLPTSLTNQQVEIIKKTMNKLQKLMKETNPYVKDFIHICEIPEEDIRQGKLVISCKERPKGAHERTYNKQTSLSEVSILTNSEPGDIVLRKREGGLQFVYDIHPAAQALHFIVLFPFGTDGYDEQTKHVKGDTKRRVTPREFFAFHLNMRDKSSDFLFRAGRLFQEYTCIAYTTIESQKLKFQRNNQKALRADTYKNVKEVVAELMPMSDRIYNDDHMLRLGKKIVLSKSFIGSPRWYNSQFQDGMAICREHHKPDFFITMTCNPNWVEIQRELRSTETAQDRPDIVARVFKLKKDQLLRDISHGKVFGKVPAILWVIEFQKRGLPHIHILVILADDDRITSSSEVDNVISTELPPDPDLFPVGSDAHNQAMRLEEIIVKNMVHGPCGKNNPDSPCMSDGVCSKGYPKPFCDRTNLDPDNSHPQYQRLSPENGGRSIVVKVKGKEYVVDNRWIVPYSPFLSLRFNCHINIELCQSPIATKYLYKYVYKGPDRAMVRAEIEDATVDEIAEYEDLRSVGSSEACWQIFNFNITKKHPAVYALRCHLEDEQSVVFDEETASTDIENQRNTELTGFFDYNQKNPGTSSKYVDFPKKFVWKNKEWKVRKAAFDTIGRVHAINPVAGDVFYLRMLLHHDHCCGKVSFEDLKTLNGNVMESYQEVCRLLGLLQDDREWDSVLTEGSVTKLCPALRELFTTILLFCLPANPRELFNNHYLEWSDDFIKEANKTGVQLTTEQTKTLILLDIKHRLQSWERDLKSFGLHEPSESELEAINSVTENDIPVVIREELNFNMEHLRTLVEERKSKFTESQQSVFELAMDAVINKKELNLFIDARGGTGKTYVMNTILAAVRLLDQESGGSIALAVGTTGIAANLLHLGRTFHSRFKAPLDPKEDSVLSINSQSKLADLLRMAKIIVLDEAPMLHRYLLEALDRTLRDITENDKPFGGKVLILSGDFRQTLTVLPHASSAAIVDAALNRSHLWKQFKIVELKENMRVKASGDPVLEEFDNWTLSIGNGDAATIDETDMIEIPDHMCFEIEEKSFKNPDSEKRAIQGLAEHVYPNLKQNLKKPGWMDGRAILAPTNKQVDAINNLITEAFPGSPSVLTSSDELFNPEDLSRFNTEYLNSLNPSGLPMHRLFLKNGMPLMLLRNLNPKMGLCNGTRLIFHQVHSNNLLECSIAGGEFNNRKVLIPRITLKPKDKEFAFEWSRRQFPVRVCFAMTINKSQGQTLQNIGVWLNDSCFAHGQLYVAVSKVGCPSKRKFAIRKTHGSPPNATSNVVFKDVFKILSAN